MIIRKQSLISLSLLGVFVFWMFDWFMLYHKTDLLVKFLAHYLIIFYKRIPFMFVMIKSLSAIQSIEKIEMLFLTCKK